MYVISIQAGQKFVVQRLDRRDFISKTNLQMFIEQKWHLRVKQIFQIRK